MPAHKLLAANRADQRGSLQVRHFCMDLQGVQVRVAFATILTGVLEVLLVHALNVNAQHIVAGKHLATIGTRVGATALVVNLLVFVQRLPILEGFATIGAVKILPRHLVNITHMPFQCLH